jgi:hypothetical protein
LRGRVAIQDSRFQIQEEAVGTIRDTGIFAGTARGTGTFPGTAVAPESRNSRLKIPDSKRGSHEEISATTFF